VPIWAGGGGHVKKPRIYCGSAGSADVAVSNDTYVAGLVALATRADLEFDGLAFLKRPFVVSALDIGAVDEEVIAVFSGDEAEALAGVEEFHGSFCQCSSFFASPEPKASSPTKPRRDTQPGTQPKVGDSSPPDSAQSQVNMGGPSPEPR